MFKAIALLKAKSGLTRSEFVEHYEKVHAPLILSVNPYIRAYRRNYVDASTAILGPGASMITHDVITEILYESEAAYRQSIAHYQSGAGREIMLDESTFLDRDKIMFFHVKECVSVIDDAARR